MNQFELYCMIYYVLDAAWEENKEPKLGSFLSGANPFLFTDIGSADPTVYADFCKKVNKPITLENSYEIACEYIAGLNNKTLSEAFATIGEEEWIECAKDYLSQEHKGGNGQ